MYIGIPQETRAGETRVAATPETVKKYVAQGHKVVVQAGAGVRRPASPTALMRPWARPSALPPRRSAPTWCWKVRAPETAELAQMKPGSVLVGMLNPFDTENNARMAAASVTALRA
ncbi:hypothetical protein ACTMU2_33345 [Cupriavidus basilensis]